MGVFFFYLTGFVFFRCRSYRSLPCLGSLARSPACSRTFSSHSSLLYFTLVSYFACYSSLGRLDCCLVSLKSRLAPASFFGCLHHFYRCGLSHSFVRFLLHLIISHFTLNLFHICYSLIFRILGSSRVVCHSHFSFLSFRCYSRLPPLLVSHPPRSAS